MDMNQPPVSPLPPPYMAPPPGIFGTRAPSTITFVVGILLFLLPFAEIKCGGMALVTKSGLDIALNNDWKPAQGSFFDKKQLQEKNDFPEKEGNARIFAIAALGLGILGLLLSFANAVTAGTAGLITGILSAGSLIGLMIDMKKTFNNLLAKDALKKTGEEMDNAGLQRIGDSMNNAVMLNFTPWFYVSLIAFLVAAFFCYRRLQLSKRL